MQAGKSASWCAGTDNVSLPHYWDGEKIITRMKLSCFWTISLKNPVLPAHGEYHFAGQGKLLLEKGTPSSGSVLEKSVLISSIPIKLRNKSSHQVHLLLMSSALCGEMPKPKKTSSCRPPQATGPILHQGWSSRASTLGSALVSCSCNAQQAWAPLEWKNPWVSPGLSSPRAP